MSKKPDTQTEPQPQAVDRVAVVSAIHARWVACTQSTGRCGKSTTIEGLITWLKFAEVPFQAFDADGVHRTLSNRYPDDVERFSAANNDEEFSRLMQRVAKVSEDFGTVMTDFPAQITPYFLAAVERFSLLEILDKKQIRPTILTFAANDTTAKASASETIRAFGDRADYLLIENPARFKSDGFHATKLGKWFADRGTPTVVIPEVLESTIAAWENLERKLKRYLPLAEACDHPELNEFQQAELQFMRDRMSAQFEEHAGRLLPDVSLIQNRTVKRKTAGVYKPVNPLEDDMY
jgi:hypothetical protein